MIDHLSPSQISMFLRCPKQWEFRYVKGIKIPPSGAMVLGSAYHEGLAERFKYVLAHEEQPELEYALDMFDLSFERIKAEHIALEDEESLPFDEIEWETKPGELKDMGVKLLTAYEKGIAPHILPTSVEDKETLNIDGIPLVTITDLTTPDRIIDHKVKGRRFSEDDLRQDIQATGYWVTKGKPLDFHVALKTRKPAIEIQRTSRTDDDAQNFYELVTKVWQAIQTGVFYPSPVGWHCNEKWCGYWNLCRYRK